MHTLLLASKSPRRRQLISELGFPVKFVDISVEENVPSDIPVEQIAVQLAKTKAEGYKETLAKDEILVTADTIVVHQGSVLGKPCDAEHAVKMLKSLAGDWHTVYTGVCLRDASRTSLFVESTKVLFRDLGDDEIRHYVEMGTCMDKAGAYGIQEWIGMVGVSRIEGCYYNVMGLPLSRLYQELRSLIK